MILGFQKAFSRYQNGHNGYLKNRTVDIALSSLPKNTSLHLYTNSLCFDTFGIMTMVENNEKSTASISCQSLLSICLNMYFEIPCSIDRAEFPVTDLSSASL